MKKVNVIINKLNSEKVYNNGKYEITVDGQNVVLQDEVVRMTAPIPRLDDSNELLICHDGQNIINTLLIHKPKNEVKRLFWRYGFRNNHYCRNKIEVKRRLSKNSQLIYQSDNIVLYCIENVTSIKTRYSADLIYVDFNNVKECELEQAVRYMGESRMEPMNDSRYVFD